MGLGYMRIQVGADGYSILDMAVEPTIKQYRWIYDIAKLSYDELRIDLRQGVAATYEPLSFKGKVHPHLVINKIKDFYR